MEPPETSVAGEGDWAASAHQGVFGAGVTFAATLVIGLVSSIVLARIYGASVIGEFALVSVPNTMLVQLSNVGEQVALIRTLSSEPVRSPRTTATFLVVLAFSTGLTLAVAVVVAPASVVLLRIADHADLIAPAMAMLLAYVVVDNASWNGDRMLIAIHRPEVTFAVRVVQLMLLLVASVAFAGGSPDVWGLTYATLLAYLFGFVARTVLVMRSLDLRTHRDDLRGAFEDLPRLLRFGIRVVPGGFAGGIAAPAATWLIGATRPSEVLGAYSRASGMASRLQEASYRVDDVLLPALARWCNRWDYDTAALEMSRLRLAVMVTLGACCAAVAGAARGLLAVFGPEFTQASAALALLMFAYSLALVASMHHQFLLALERPGATSKLAMLRTGLIFAALVPLTIAFGAGGAGAAFLIGYGVELAVALRWSDQQIARSDAALLPLPWRRLAVTTFAGTAVAWVVDNAIGSILGGLVGAALGFGAFVALGSVLKLVPSGEILQILRQHLGQPPQDADGGGRDGYPDPPLDLDPAPDPDPVPEAAPTSRPAGVGPAAVGAAEAGAGQAGRPPIRVDYVVSRYPKVTETFVYEEIHAVRDLGFDIRLLAMVGMHEGVVQPRAAELAGRVTFGARSPLRLAGAQLRWAARRPLALATLWWALLRRCWRAPGQIAKGAVATLVAAEWARRLERDPPDHIHAHFATWAAHCAYVVAGLLGTPYSVTGHAHDLFGPNRMLGEKLARARFVVVISDYERRLLAERFPDLRSKVHLIHCGVDLDAYPLRPQPVRPARSTAPSSLLCVASLTGYKGHPVLLRACAALRRRGRYVHCALVGDGPERAALEAAARELGIVESVRFWGRVEAPAVRQLMLKADVVVQPSVIAPHGKMEGIPVALMEALAFRRPVVASDLSGIPELVEDGVTGLLVPPGDVGALVEAIEWLLDDPELGKRLGSAGRARVEEAFDVRITARKLAALLARDGGR